MRPQVAYEIPGFLPGTLVAGADLSSDQYKLVTLAADGQLDVTGAVSSNNFIGVLQNKPSAAGQSAEVMVSGVSKMIVGATITAGDELVPSAVTAGRVDPTPATGERIVGVALESGAVGELISVLLGFAAPHAA